MPHRARVVGLVTVVAAAVLAGCGGSEGERSGDADSTASTEEFTVQGALVEVPAIDADDLMVHTADLREATELAGLELPTSGSRDAVAPWVLGLTGAGSPDEEAAPIFVPMPSSFNLEAAAPDEFADQLGFSILDADAFVEASAPPATFATVVGDVDEGTLSDELVEVEDGILTDRDAGDFETDLEEVSAASRIGVPLRLAARDGRIALSTATPLVRTWLDDAGDSLAEVEGMSAVARALDQHDVVSAALTPATGAGVPAEEMPTDPFDAVGVGWSATDGRAQVHAAYHFGSDDSAAAARDGLERTYRDGVSVQAGTPFAEWVTVEDVQAEGTVVVVTVTPTDGERPGFLYEALRQQDALFVSR